MFENGDIYDGEWLKGIREGKLTLLNGTVFTGDLEGDFRNGHGEVTFGSNENYNDGEKYIGEWRNDQMHGTGTLMLNSGSVYEGAWENNLRNGQGITYGEHSSYGQENVYIGEWKDGEKNGKGKSIKL